MIAGNYALWKQIQEQKKQTQKQKAKLEEELKDLNR